MCHENVHGMRRRACYILRRTGGVITAISRVPGSMCRCAEFQFQRLGEGGLVKPVVKSDVVMISLFAGLACMDVVKRRVPCWLVESVMGVAVYMACAAKRSFLDYAGVLLLGGIFFALSLWSKEAVGLGDAWGILAVLLAKGFFEGLAALLTAFLLAALWSMGILFAGKIRKTCGCGEKRIPFLPCLLAGYVLGSL